MSEPTKLKYDPDVIDPIIVNDLRPIWHLFVVYGFGAIDLAVLFHWRLNSAYARAYQPGQWVGAAPFMEGLYHFATAAFCIIFAATIAIILRRFGTILLLAGIFSLVYFVGFSDARAPNPAARYLVELPKYQEAIRSGVKYGDQYSEVVNGRQLTYWRWMTWDLDNAVGVIYDPSDKLSKEEDMMAFRGPSTGVLLKVEKIEPHWYFVEHS